MPANKFLAPFAVLALLFLYLAWEVDPGYAKYLIPCLVVAALIYVSSPQINWWWWQRNPPDLEPQLHAWLEHNSLFYNSLPAAERRHFRSRIFLHRENIDWTPMAWPDEKVPTDVQLAIASQAAMLTLGRPDFLFSKFEKVIVYPKPFLSPEHPQPHASELFEPDGCLIFSAEQLMFATMQPGQFFNPVLYEYARAFALSFPETRLPIFPDEAPVWEKLAQVGGHTRPQIEETIGLPNLDATAAAVHHFFTFPVRFAAVFPAEAEAMRQAFRP